MNTRSPLDLFLLVFALAVPFYFIGATGLQILPGLPATAPFLALCPAAAAAILVYRKAKMAGVVALLRRAVDYERIQSKAWCTVIVLLMPVVMVGSYGLMRWMNLGLPSSRWSPGMVLAMFLSFLVAAMGEELGWTAYALEPLQERWNALRASLLLGVIWAAYHLVPLLQAHRAPTWIAGWFLFTMATRIILTWIYNNTGKSTFAAALYHAMANLSVFLFPVYGSHYDPRVTGPMVAGVALLVTVVWGPKALARP